MSAASGSGAELTEGIEAFLFDMDGTLLDSECLTEAAVKRLLALRGIEVELDGDAFHGVTWRSIAEMLRRAAPALGDEPLDEELQERFHQALVETVPPMIPGATGAVAAASRQGRAALVSSSNRASVEHVVGRLALGDLLDTLVCAEDVTRSKPAPECFLTAAARLGVEPRRCLVFEDSEAGLLAARAAGMRTVVIGGRREPADLAVDDFTQLPPGFWQESE